MCAPTTYDIVAGQLSINVDPNMKDEISLIQGRFELVV